MNQPGARGRRIAVPLTTLLLAALTLTACSSGAKSGGGGTVSASAAAADNAVLGADVATSGTPVKLGFAYDGKSAAIDTTPEVKAAEAVVKYANAKLGGLNGHPIVLDSCEDMSDPATATDCGNQFVKDGVVAIAGGSLGQLEPLLKPVNPVGIPYVDILNQSPALFAVKTDFSILNPLNAYVAGAVLAKQHSFKHTALLVIDMPAATSVAKSLGTIIWKNAGAALDVVPIAVGTADMTPQVQTEEAKHVDQYYPTFCSSAVKAIKALGSKAFVSGLDRCLDATSAKTIPGGFSGMRVFTTANQQPADPEFKLYSAVRSTYGDGTEGDGNYVAGYQATLSLVRAINAGKPASFSPADVATAIRSATKVPIPLGGGGAFTCDGTAYPALSAGICSTAGDFADATAAGGLTNYSSFDDPAIGKIG